jgi:acylphosphatase
MAEKFEIVDCKISKNKNGDIEVVNTFKEKKTDDMKTYMRNYMKKYTENKETIVCDICKGKYKPHQKYIHINRQKHRLCVVYEEKNKKQEEIAELLEKILIIQNTIKV